MNTVTEINRTLIRNSFNRAAFTYDNAAAMQLEVGSRLIERLDYMKIIPKVALDIGASTGRFSLSLQKLYPQAQVVSIDLADKMLRYGLHHKEQIQHAVCADASRLPLQSASVDLIFSNLTFQWIYNLKELFSEINRVLKPGGMLLFATLGPDTLYELRSSFSDQYLHVNKFLDMHTVGDALLNCDFLDPVMDKEYLTLTYKSIKQLMQELQLAGTNNLNTKRNHSLTGKNSFKAMQNNYQQFKTTDNLYPATYEVVYGHALKLVKNKVTNNPAGLHYIPADNIPVKSSRDYVA